MEMYRLGIMQGRLSPIYEGRIQSFPANDWKNEFDIAAECGFDIMEWVIDIDHPELNPIFKKDGRKEVNNLQKNSGISVPSVCCDYFMKNPLQHSVIDSFASRGLLLEICRLCPEIGIRLVELPLIGKAGLGSMQACDRMLDLFEVLEPVLVDLDLKLLLETDLAPEEFKFFLDKIDSDRVQVNYDTGNSAYWDYDVEKEFNLYGDKIGNIHIKDCTPEDYSVPLGDGNVDFDLSFSKFKEKKYSGDFILQTARGNDDIESAKVFRDFTLSFISKYLL